MFFTCTARTKNLITLRNLWQPPRFLKSRTKLAMFHSVLSAAYQWSHTACFLTRATMSGTTAKIRLISFGRTSTAALWWGPRFRLILRKELWTNCSRRKPKTCLWSRSISNACLTEATWPRCLTKVRLRSPRCLAAITQRVNQSPYRSLRPSHSNQRFRRRSRCCSPRNRSHRRRKWAQHGSKIEKNELATAVQQVGNNSWFRIKL